MAVLAIPPAPASPPAWEVLSKLSTNQSLLPVPSLPPSPHAPPTAFHHFPSLLSPFWYLLFPPSHSSPLILFQALGGCPRQRTPRTPPGQEMCLN